MSGKQVDVRLPKFIPTGCKALDDLFGGYESGVLTLFYGPTGSGKTTLATYLPIAVISKYLFDKYGGIPEDHYFYVVDGDNGTDADRLKQILEAWGLSVNEVLSHVAIFRPREFDEQHKYITAEIPGMIAAGRKPLLISVDPATAIYRGIVTRADSKFRTVKIQEYTGKLDLQLKELWTTASKTGCVAIVTSWPRSVVSLSEMAKMPEDAVGVDKPAPCIGGRAFGFYPKVIVEIRVPREGDVHRVAFLYKHRSKPSGRTAGFRLSDRGVEDV